MIIIKIFGGLGNQMFQYAFGKALSLKYNRKLFIDKSYFDEENYPYDLHSNHYPYKLDLYNIHEDFIPSTISKYQKIISLKRLYKLTNPLVNHFAKNLPVYFNKRNFTFNNLKKTNYAFLNGHWQNYDIIVDYKNEIRKIFELRDITEKAKQTLDDINLSNSISVHFRKGDYLSNPKFKAVYAHCNADYYRNAMVKIRGKVDNPKYFIFSDNMDWVKNNINISDNMYFVSDAVSDYEQQYLMSQCKNNIIANSSFSWWGAWLNKYDNKIVIAPKKWFANFERDNDVFYPINWTIANN
jgi:hypothetical protein